MHWFFFAILTAFLWGIGQIFIKKGLSSISPLWNNIFAALISIVIYVPVALYLGFVLPNMEWIVLILLSSLGYIIYYYAIEKGFVTLTGTILAMYPAVTIFLSFIFLQEVLLHHQIALVLLIFFGVVLLTRSQATSSSKSLKASWLIWSLGGALSIGTSDFLAKVIITKIGVPSYIFFLPIGFTLGSTILWQIDKKGRVLGRKINIRHLLFSLCGITAMTLGLLSFNQALETGMVSLVSTISSSYIGITAILALIFLKERLSRMQLIGVIAIFFGILFIG